jgi:hypothetical protein
LRPFGLACLDRCWFGSWWFVEERKGIGSGWRRGTGRELQQCGHHEIEGEDWQQDEERNGLTLGIASVKNVFIALSSNDSPQNFLTLVNERGQRNLQA